jgi:hypothetical protein
MSDDAKFPTILPAALADFADTLDAVGELDEAEKPARHLALQAILGFFQSAGIDKEVLHRLWQQQEAIEQLKKNVRTRDAMEDPLQGTLFTLAHIRTTFELLGIESETLDKLEHSLCRMSCMGIRIRCFNRGERVRRKAKNDPLTLIGESASPFARAHSCKSTWTPTATTLSALRRRWQEF